MKRSILIGISMCVPLLFAACAGKPVADGPVYYVTDGVMKVIYDESAAQIVCADETLKGSHIKHSRCFTAAEVIARHKYDRRRLSRWEQSCPTPSLCKK